MRLARAPKRNDMDQKHYWDGFLTGIIFTAAFALVVVVLAEWLA